MKQRILSWVNSILSENASAEVALLGLGTTNRAILDIILQIPNLKKITVFHKGDADLPDSVIRRDFPNPGTPIDADIVFASPSVRREKLTLGEITVLTSDTELFFTAEARNRFLISGSDGKSTVSAMTASLLKERFPGLFLGGNIGTPVALCDLSGADAAVIELSSFNLNYIKPGSDRALITNITPNHLDWHSSYEEYVLSKENLLLHSREPIVNVDTPACRDIARRRKLYAVCSSVYTYKELAAEYCAKHIFSLENGRILLDGEAMFSTVDLFLKERHNAVNFMSAMALTHGYAKSSDVLRVAKSFRGLPHRCECFFEKDGVTFIDSSIDTTPERTAATMYSLNKRVKLILGGRGKGLDLMPLKKPILKYARKIAIYGDIRDEIKEFLSSDSLLCNISRASFKSFSDAADYITEDLVAGDCVLLSPAATSYGEFSNFEERGRLFRKIIQNKYRKI